MPDQDPKPKPKRKGRKPKKRKPDAHCLLTVRMKGSDYNRLIDQSDAAGISLEALARKKLLSHEI